MAGAHETEKKLSEPRHPLVAQLASGSRMITGVRSGGTWTASDTQLLAKAAGRVL